MEAAVNTHKKGSPTMFFDDEESPLFIWPKRPKTNHVPINDEQYVAGDRRLFDVSFIARVR